MKRGKNMGNKSGGEVRGRETKMEKVEMKIFSQGDIPE